MLAIAIVISIYILDKKRLNLTFAFVDYYIDSKAKKSKKFF